MFMGYKCIEPFILHILSSHVDINHLRIPSQSERFLTQNIGHFSTKNIRTCFLYTLDKLV